MNFSNAEFIKSAASPSDFLRDARGEIVFAGRSNVGKSSVINALLNRKNFARVGETPGKTVLVNYFSIDEKLLFVDLPGYGYAKASHVDRDYWARLIGLFFAVENRRRHGLLIVDSRHGPTALDMTMAEYFEGHGVPFTVVANKTDKLKKSELALQREKISAEFSGRAEAVMFSAKDKSGREPLLAVIKAFEEGKE